MTRFMLIALAALPTLAFAGAAVAACCCGDACTDCANCACCCS